MNPGFEETDNDAEADAEDDDTHTHTDTHVEFADPPADAPQKGSVKPEDIESYVSEKEARAGKGSGFCKSPRGKPKCMRCHTCLNPSLKKSCASLDQVKNTRTRRGSAVQGPAKEKDHILGPHHRSKDSFRGEGPKPVDCEPVLGDQGSLKCVGKKGVPLVHPYNMRQGFYKYENLRSDGRTSDVFYILWDLDKRDIIPFKKVDRHGTTADRYSLDSLILLRKYYCRLEAGETPEHATVSDTHERAAANATETNEQAAANATETNEQAAANATETNEQAAANATETNEQAAANATETNEQAENQMLDATGEGEESLTEEDLEDLAASQGPPRRSDRHLSVEQQLENANSRLSAKEQEVNELNRKLKSANNELNKLKENFWEAFFNQIGPNMPEGEDQEQSLKDLEQMQEFLFDNQLNEHFGSLPFKFKHNMLFALFQFPDLTPFTHEMRNKLGLGDGEVQKAGQSMRYFDLTEDAVGFVNSMTSKNESKNLRPKMMEVRYMDIVQIYCKHVVQMVEDILGEKWNLDIGITGQNPARRFYNKQPLRNAGNAFLMYKFEQEKCKTFQTTPRELAESVEDRMQSWLKLRKKSVHGAWRPGGKVAEESATTYVYLHFYKGNGAVPT